MIDHVIFEDQHTAKYHIEYVMAQYDAESSQDVFTISEFSEETMPSPLPEPEEVETPKKKKKKGHSLAHCIGNIFRAVVKLFTGSK